MKNSLKYVLPVLVVAVIAFYIFLNQGSNSAAMNPPAGSPATDTSGSGTTASVTPAGGGTLGGTAAEGTTPAGTTVAPSQPTAQYKDGTYQGTVADAVYGQLQVIATIQGGKLADVSWPVYPNSPGHTSQVSAEALPQLKQEAIAAQSANIDVVSGATQDSQAFQQSLASALAQAKS